MRAPILIAAAGTLIAAVGGYTVGGGARGAEARAPITRLDLNASTADNALDAIRALRPDWLVQDPATAGETPAVYLETPCTEITCLHWIELDLVEDVRLVETEQGDAIVVTMRTRSQVYTLDFNRR